MEVVVDPTDREQPGVVLDKDGKPVAGAEVSWPGGQSLTRTVADSEGRFRLKGLPHSTKVRLMANRDKRYGYADSSNETASIEIRLH